MGTRRAWAAIGLALSLAVGPVAAVAGATGAPVASGATRLVVRVDRGFDATGPRYSASSTSDRSLIARLIEGVDALPAAPTGTTSCPIDLGARVVLLFFRDGADHPYAVVVADPQGCGDVAVITHDGTGRDVERLSGGLSLATAALAALGLAPLD
ncbi:MAG TPA: hypothetical protein PLS29_00275 [Acidimicrobiales bacterium]|nr:MAG: hypothetical protein B7Z69_02370 [Actinobacteria bacterium 21-73-9]HQU25442.1 hypothetical protein [Acidimicrobiales bacterium]